MNKRIISARQDSPYWLIGKTQHPFWFIPPLIETLADGATGTFNVVTKDGLLAAGQATDVSDGRNLVTTQPGWFTQGLNNGTTYPGYSNVVWMKDSVVGADFLSRTDIGRNKSILALSITVAENAVAGFLESLFYFGVSGGSTKRYWAWRTNASGNHELVFRKAQNAGGIVTIDIGVAATAAPALPGERIGLILDPVNQYAALYREGSTMALSQAVIDSIMAQIGTGWSADGKDDGYQSQGIGLTLFGFQTGTTPDARTVDANAGTTGYHRDAMIWDLTGLADELADTSKTDALMQALTTRGLPGTIPRSIIGTVPGLVTL